MDTGIDGLLIGVGPGAACTSREVLGLGVPTGRHRRRRRRARRVHTSSAARYVPVITDGGMSTGGDVCKAFAAGMTR